LDVHVRETEAPGEDLFPELMPEVLPGPEVLPERDPEVLRETDPPPASHPDRASDLEPASDPESAPHPEPAGEPRRVVPAPLTLHRFLDRAKPSLGEATSLASLVLDAIGALHDAGCTHGRLDSRTVRLTPEGEVHLAGLEPARSEPGDPDPQARKADVRAAAAVVAEIDKATGRPVRPLTDREARMADRLAAAADPASLTRRGLRRAARGLDMAIGRADQREAARAGLAGLIRAVAGYDAISVANGHGAMAGTGPTGIGPTGIGPAGIGPTGPAPLARRLPPPARRAPVWPKLWKPVAIVAAVLLVFGVEVTFFGDKVTRNVKTLMTHEAAAAEGPKLPAALPDLGPPTAGPITHLELRPLDGCKPATTCNAVVQVALAPQPVPVDVTWNFELFDRCGTLRETRPGGVMSVPAGADRAVQTVAVALPAGQALALVPVATAPARVAGSPMPLSPGDRPC
jgi:hypothetical protein